MMKTAWMPGMQQAAWLRALFSPLICTTRRDEERARHSMVYLEVWSCRGRGQSYTLDSTGSLYAFLVAGPCNASCSSLFCLLGHKNQPGGFLRSRNRLLPAEIASRTE